MMTTRHPSPTLPGRARRRGFTLVELLVAMAAGLVVSMAAFLLAKNATQFFQNEARFSGAHLAATLGMSRLSADLRRASFLSSPNVQRDPKLCGQTAGWPDGMSRLAGIAITKQTPIPDQSAANRLYPDSIVIGGSFDTTELFPYTHIQQVGGGGLQVFLSVQSTAVQRTLARAGGDPNVLSGIFRAGRILRLQRSGQTKFMYGVIQNIQFNNPLTQIIVTLAATPALPTGRAFDCALGEGFSGDGGYANPVSRVRYELRSLAGHPRYGPIVAPIAGSLTGDDGRTELIRVELDADDNEMANTLELIAEYAVDLQFGLTIDNAPPGDGRLINPQLQRLPIVWQQAPSAVHTIAGDITTLAGARPEDIRAVQVRLSTRTRAPDRQVDLDGRDPNGDGRKFRFLIPGAVPGITNDTQEVPAGSGPAYARMRTLYADIALPNQAEVPW